MKKDNYIGRKVEFDPKLSFKDMGGEDELCMTEDEFSKFIGKVGTIIGEVIHNGPDFDMNYYAILFEDLGALNAWSGSDFILL